MTNNAPHEVALHFEKYFTAFLEAYLTWVESDPPYTDLGDVCEWDKPAGFSTHAALCGNFQRYLLDNGLFKEPDSNQWFDEVYPMLKSIYREMGMHTRYPFGEDDYDYHEDHGTHHKHEPRMAWVRQYLKNAKLPGEFIFDQYFPKFTAEYLVWAESDPPMANYDHHFDRQTAMCGNFRNYLIHKGVLKPLVSKDVRLWCEEILPTMVRLFIKDGLDPYYPFSSMDVYVRESYQQTHHRNPARLDWLYKYIAKTAMSDV